MTGEDAVDDPASEQTPVETAVCFDLDGTLVTFDDGYGAVLADGLREGFAGADLDAAVAAASEGFRDAFEAMAAEPYRAGVVAAAEAVDGGPAAGAGDAVDAVVADWRDAEVAHTVPRVAVADCLEALSADESVVVCVVTDGLPDWQRAKLAAAGLDGFVDHVVTSYGVGGHKTSGAPYAAVRERVDASEYVMVGDDPESDVAAAREAGFVPIQFEDGEGPAFFATLRAML